MDNTDHAQYKHTELHCLCAPKPRDKKTKTGKLGKESVNKASY